MLIQLPYAKKKGKSKKRSKTVGKSSVATKKKKGRRKAKSTIKNPVKMKRTGKRIDITIHT